MLGTSNCCALKGKAGRRAGDAHEAGNSVCIACATAACWRCEVQVLQFVLDCVGAWQVSANGEVSRVQ